LNKTATDTTDAKIIFLIAIIFLSPLEVQQCLYGFRIASRVSRHSENNDTTTLTLNNTMRL
ncbi:MAG: hypothetical protein WBC05_08875, partial [Sedimentisphaerales bacterium]